MSVDLSLSFNALDLSLSFNALSIDQVHAISPNIVPGFTDLPVEIVRRIVSFLPKGKLPSMVGVNRIFFNTFAPECTPEIDVQTYTSRHDIAESRTDTLWDPLSAIRTVSHLDNAMELEKEQVLYRRLTNVTKLHFSLDQPFRPETLEIIKSWPHLNQLRVYICKHSPDYFDYGLFEGKHVELVCPSAPTLESVLAPTLQALATVESWTCFGTPFGIEKYPEAALKLTALTMVGPGRRRSELVLSTFREAWIPKLQKLQLQMFRFPARADQGELFECLMKLPFKKLSLQNVHPKFICEFPPQSPPDALHLSYGQAGEDLSRVKHEWDQFTSWVASIPRRNTKGFAPPCRYSDRTQRFQSIRGLSNDSSTF